MTRVLIIASRADVAGGEHYLLSCFAHLDRTRYEPIVWLPGDGDFRVALEKAQIEYVIEPVNYGWLRPPMPWYEFLSGLPERVRRIVKLIRDRDIRLVHTNSNMILEGALAAKLAGVPHLYAAHIDFQPDLPIYARFPLDPASFARLMGDLSSEILAVSEHVRDTLCPPLPRERVSVVHNGLEMARYDAALASGARGLRHSLGLEEDALLVVAAGRVSADKGFDLLVEAVRMCFPAHPKAVLLLCGAIDSPEFHASLVRRIDELDLGKRVLLLGRRNDLPELMAQCDLFVLSSRREGHPYVLLEAMACNLPTVATCCGGVVETVTEENTSFIVPIGNSAAIASRMDELLADSGLRKRLGRLAGAHVRRYFTAQTSAAGLFLLYERLLEAPAPVAGSYTADLLLQAASEVGHLGQRLTALEERVKKGERAADLLLGNPISVAIRKLFRR